MNDARPTSSGVYCIEHVPHGAVSKNPQSSSKEESGSTKAVKGAFFTILFLTAGLGIIIFAGQYFVDQFSSQYGSAGFSQIKSAIESLQSVGNLIFYFMIFLTAILGLGWFVLSRQQK